MKQGTVEPLNPVCLSIVISCFNYRAFVARAIESVLRQSLEHCELLVVDDGSTDGSWDIIQSYGIAKSFRLANGGALQACRHGLEQAAAPFVLFLDADDELAPGSLERILPLLKPGVAKLQFPLTPIDADGRVLGPPSPALKDETTREQLQREVLRTGCYTSPPTSGNVFSRPLCELLHEVDYERWIDGVMLFAAPFYGAVVSLSDPLGFYRLHGRNGSQSGTQPDAQRFANEARRFLLRHDHLRRILAARDVRDTLVDGASVFFYRERRLYQAILEGMRPRLGAILALQRLVLTMDRPVGHRLTMSLLFWLMLVLPQQRRREVLAYRFEPGRRSVWGLMRKIIHVRPDLNPA